MTTAQLSLPLDQVLPTPSRPVNKLQEKALSTLASVGPKKRRKKLAATGTRVEELRSSSHNTELFTLAEEFLSECGTSQHIDTDVLIHTMLRIQKDFERDFLNAFIAYKYDQPVGFLVASCQPSLYNRTVEAHQNLWFVSKQHRSASGAAILLMDAYESWARLNGATHIFTGSVHPSSAEKTSKLLTKLGFTRVGVLHCKEV